MRKTINRLIYIQKWAQNNLEDATTVVKETLVFLVCNQAKKKQNLHCCLLILWNIQRQVKQEHKRRFYHFKQQHSEINNTIAKKKKQSTGLHLWK